MKSYQFGKFIGATGSVLMDVCSAKFYQFGIFFCCCRLLFKTDACSMKFYQFGKTFLLLLASF
jgi:hypothetical protein